MLSRLDLADEIRLAVRLEPPGAWLFTALDLAADEDTTPQTIAAATLELEAEGVPTDADYVSRAEWLDEQRPDWTPAGREYYLRLSAAAVLSFVGWMLASTTDVEAGRPSTPAPWSPGWNGWGSDV